MDREPFSIHPVLEAHIRKQSEEENRLLEESILAEGCRDPLVVWREEGVLVDGHHRKAICDKHGVPYSVVYRSFANIEAVKAWMDLNQLGRRNLSKEDRDTLIRRLAAAGVPQRKIAATAKCSQGTVSNIANKMIKNDHSPTIKSTSAAEELEAKQKEIAALQEKVRLLDSLKHLHKEHDRELETLRLENSRIAAALEEAKKPQAPVALPEVVEKIVEKEVTPPEVEAKLREQENLIYELQRREAGNPRLEEKRNALLKEIERLRGECSKTRVEASFDGVISLIMNQKALARNLVELSRNGDLTIEQMDEAQNLMNNVICAANDVLNELREIRGDFKKGGGLRAL